MYTYNDLSHLAYLSINPPLSFLLNTTSFGVERVQFYLAEKMRNFTLGDTKKRKINRTEKSFGTFLRLVTLKQTLYFYETGVVSWRVNTGDAGPAWEQHWANGLCFTLRCLPRRYALLN